VSKGGAPATVGRGDARRGSHAWFALGWSALFAGVTPPVALLLAAASILVAVPSFGPYGSDLDSGWAIGVTLAWEQGLRFGHDVVFTYGPWAFLDVLSTMSFATTVLGTLGWVTSGLALVLAAWRLSVAWLHPLGAALVVALVFAPPLAIPELQFGFSARMLLLAIMLGIGLAVRVVPARMLLPMVIALSAASMLALQAKFSNGILALATTFLIAVLVPGRTVVARLITLGWMTLASAIAGTLFWLLAGQSLGDVPAWIRGSLELTSGYAEAMATIHDPWIGTAIFAAVLLIVVLAIGLARVRSWREDWAVFVLVAWACFLAFRLGFTRLDGVHLGQTLLVLLGSLLALGMARRGWLAVAATVAAASLVFAGWQSSYFSTVEPAGLAARITGTTQALVSSGIRTTINGVTRNGITSELPLGAAVEDALANKGVHVDGSDTAVVYGYDLDWAPVPVFQSYSAYTTYLDGLNAAALRDPDGPEVVLRGPAKSLNDRSPRWEAPAYYLELICSFAPVVTTDDWLVLERVDRRCQDEPTELETVSFQAGEAIAVPEVTEGSMLVASVHTEASVVQTVAAALLRPISRLTVTADGRQYRLTAALQEGPLVLRMPETAGWDAQFVGGTDTNVLAFSRPGTITFSTIRVTGD
jgi:hypothetical protein